MAELIYYIKNYKFTIIESNDTFKLTYPESYLTLLNPEKSNRLRGESSITCDFGFIGKFLRPRDEVLTQEQIDLRRKDLYASFTLKNGRNLYVKHFPEAKADQKFLCSCATECYSSNPYKGTFCSESNGITVFYLDFKTLADLVAY